MPGQPLDLLSEVRLAGELARSMAVPSVDLVDLRRAPLRLSGRILREGRLLSSIDEPGRVDYEVRTRAAYFDFLPTSGCTGVSTCVGWHTVALTTDHG